MGSNGAVGLHDHSFTKGKTVVVRRKGSIGRIAFANSACWPIDTTYYVDEVSTHQDLRWLHWMLQSLGLENMNKSVAVPGLSRDDVYRIEIPLPPLPEQRLIVSILDRADNLRAKRRATIDKLEELELATFDLTFREQSREIVESVPLGDAYWFQEGPGVRNWQFTAEGVNLLNVGNILKSGVLDLTRTTKRISSEEANGKYRHFLVDQGDFLIASSGISFDTDGYLRTRGAFVGASDLPLWMNTSTIRFKAVPKI